MTVTVSPLVRLRARFPPAARLNEPFAHAEPASDDDDVKPKVRAGGGEPTTCLTIVSERSCCSEA